MPYNDNLHIIYLNFDIAQGNSLQQAYNQNQVQNNDYMKLKFVN